ncbi:hypothetical protein ABZ654_23710 [Streptomyces hygroscopicus]|uniref:hypothetical protein n=1 Tax=Streptomyces hygroscopicus TaxID=1912 RepID=UPI0033F1423C
MATVSGDTSYWHLFVARGGNYFDRVDLKRQHAESANPSSKKDVDAATYQTAAHGGAKYSMPSPLITIEAVERARGWRTPRKSIDASIISDSADTAVAESGGAK